MGTLMANNQGQSAIAKIPAATVGPAAAATEMINPLIPIQRAKKRAGKITLSKAVMPLEIAAALKPCKPRAITKVINESERAHISEVTVNILKPNTYTRLYPQRSPKEEKASKEMVIAN